MNDEEDQDDSLWLYKKVDGIYYFIHEPSQKCGIHIRGFAQLCGVHHTTIMGILKNAQKVEGGLVGLRESYINRLLKDRDIFLEDLVGLSPTLNGKPVKVILSDVCFDVASYYALEGRMEAVDTVTKMGRLGAERFIFIKIGFNPRPASVTLDEIEYLVAKEEIAVTKSRTGVVWYYTNPLTGECGIGLKSLPHLCGGVAFKHVVGYIDGHKDKGTAFIRAGTDAIVRSNVTYDTIYHFGHIASPRKSKAKEWAVQLQQIDAYIHRKTGYTEQNRQSTDELVAAMRREIERLRRQLGLYDEQGMARWHLLLGTTLDYQFSGSGTIMKSEVETTATPQRVDFVIENLRQQAGGNGVLDGLDPEADHNIVTYKSHHETLDANTINELIGYYVGYKKGIENLKDIDHSQDTYHLVAVCTRYPEALAKQAGSKWSKLKEGVYKIDLLIDITVVVTSRVEMTPNNSAWLLFSHDKQRVEYALGLPENAQIPDYIPKLLRDELERK